MDNQITDITLVFFGMSVVTSFLAMIIIAISVAYYRLSKSAHREREEFLKRQEAAKLTENQIIIKARTDAEKILVDAQSQAQTLLSSSEMFSSSYKDEFRAKLLQVIAKEEVGFKELYESIKIQNSKVIQSVSQDIEKDLSVQLESFKKAVSGEIQKAVEEYKTHAYKRVEDEVNELVATITRRVLRKSISQDEHTDLVLQALEEAKKSNVF